MEIKLILPDTNILILGLAGKKPYDIFLRKLIEEKSLVFSAITVSEFIVGATDEEEKIFIDLVRHFPILPVDFSVAQIAAYYRKKYLKKNKKLLLPDCLIAATCKVYKASLATLNKNDYPMDDIEIISEF